MDYGQKSWIEEFGLVRQTKEEQYVACIYYAFITMVTVGYGDIHPFTMYEMIFSIFMTIISCGMFGYTVNKLGEVFSNSSKKQQELQQYKYIMMDYMQKRNISMNLQMRAIKNLEYIHEQEENTNQKAIEILNKIDKKLMSDIQKENNIYIFQNIRSLVDFSEKTQRKIMSKFQESCVIPGQVLIFQFHITIYKILLQQDEIVDKFYLVLEGNIEFYQRKNEEYTLYEQNCSIRVPHELFFGEFLVDGQSKYCVRSSGNCVVLALKKEDFLASFMDCQMDKEIYFNLRQKNFSRNDRKMIFMDKQIVCQSCDQIGHFIDLCPKLHLYLQNENVIRRDNLLSELQNRSMRKCKTTHRYQNALLLRKLIQTSARLYRYRNTVHYNTIDQMDRMKDEKFLKKFPVINEELYGKYDYQTVSSDDETTIYDKNGDKYFDDVSEGDEENNKDDTSQTSLSQSVFTPYNQYDSGNSLKNFNHIPSSNSAKYSSKHSKRNSDRQSPRNSENSNNQSYIPSKFQQNQTINQEITQNQKNDQILEQQYHFDVQKSIKYKNSDIEFYQNSEASQNKSKSLLNAQAIALSNSQRRQSQLFIDNTQFRAMEKKHSHKSKFSQLQSSQSSNNKALVNPALLYQKYIYNQQEMIDNPQLVQFQTQNVLQDMDNLQRQEQKIMELQTFSTQSPTLSGQKYEEFFIQDCDQVQEYKIFQPLSNITYIMKDLKQIHIRNLKKNQEKLIRFMTKAKFQKIERKKNSSIITFSIN